MRKPDPLEGVGPAPSPADPRQTEIRRRQRSGALVMGLALAAFVILLYAITIARIGNL